MSKSDDMLNVVERIRPFISDDETYGRLYADLHDLIECSEWFLSEMRKPRHEVMTVDGVEDFLIGLDINYIKHVTFHLNSLRKDVDATLEAIGKLE